jgi:hypothetical protein
MILQARVSERGAMIKFFLDGGDGAESIPHLFIIQGRKGKEHRDGAFLTCPVAGRRSWERITGILPAYAPG